MSIQYLPFEPRYQPQLTALIQQLYQEDPSGKPISLAKIEATIKTLQTKPDLGEILLIKQDQAIIGYTILINFWSNEYGGIILHIDEIYLQPRHRSQGIGSQLINYLRTSKYKQAVALQLEVTKENHKARKLYQQLGFAPLENLAMVMDI